MRAVFAAAVVAIISASVRSEEPTPANCSVQLDHLFLWVTKDAPEAKVLTDLGLTMDKETYKHAGQGTASRAFWFEGMYLELIWADDAGVAVKKVKEMGTDLAKRLDWAKTPTTSPFAVGLVRRPGFKGDFPFATTEYKADWLGRGALRMAKSNADLAEPMVFVEPPAFAAPTAEQLPALFTAKPELKANYTHRLGVTRVTGVRIGAAKKGDWSEAATLLTKHKVVEIATEEKAVLELTFDEGKQKKTADLRPGLPLVLKY